MTEEVKKTTKDKAEKPAAKAPAKKAATPKAEPKPKVEKSAVKKEVAPKKAAEPKKVAEPKAVVKKDVVTPATKEAASAKKEATAPKVEKAVAAPPQPAKKGEKVKQLGTRGTGRRKKSIARVRLLPGKGNITINGSPLKEYFPDGFLQIIVNQPLTLTEIKDYDVIVNVQGGGLTGQAGAIRHGIARALVTEVPTTRAELKRAGYLTRDPRMKERKKYGLKKARRAPQFSKR